MFEILNVTSTKKELKDSEMKRRLEEKERF
jgi:hypothetical protein